MYPTSQEFQEKIKQQIDRRTFSKVQIDYTDPFLDQSITVAANESANASFPSQTADAVAEPFAKIASLDGSWVLDGTYAVAPTPQEAETKQMGWWGSQLAGAGGAFSTPYPTLTVTFFPRPITRLKAVGDSKRQEWPVDFSIHLYDGNNTLLYTETVTGNIEIAWSKVLDEPITQVEKMTLELTKWSHAGRQAKILEFFTSIQETYEDDNIIFIHLLEEREVSQGSLPVGNISANEIDIRLSNETRKFDAGNKQSPLYQTLKANRRIKAWLGVKDVIGEWHTEIEQSSYYYQARLCGERYVAQGFKPVGSLVGAREVWAYVLSSPTGKEGSPPDVHFHVYSNNEDVPGESISTDYGVVTGDNWPSGRQWVGTKIVLDEPLQEGQQYWLVLAGQGVYDYYDNVRYVSSDSDKYADGYRCTSSDGMTWNKTHDRDLTFRLDAPIYKDEWVPLGTFWSGDWHVPEDRVYAQTIGRDRLELLRKSTYSTSQVQMNKTLYNLAQSIFQDAGLTEEEYYIDTELQQFPVPYAWFDSQSHREALRKIAEACLGQVYCDRNGIIRIEGPSFLQSQTEPVMTITPDDYFRKDNPVKWSEIANYIEVETQPLRPDVSQEVYRSNEPIPIIAGQTKTITVYYNHTPCIEATATLENFVSGAEITKTTYYAWGANISVSSSNTGTFELVINAKPLRVLNKEKAIAQDEESILDNGMLKYTFPVNPLVQTREVAQKIADTLLAYFKNPRRDVEVEWRGNPALLLGDKIAVVDKDEENEYFVTRQELEFDGALRARMSGRRA